MSEVQLVSLKQDLSTLVVPRGGEKHLGEEIGVAGSLDDLTALQQYLQEQTRAGAKFVILGIPEDIGVRANFGRAGAADGFAAFLKAFLNTQHSEYLNPQTITLLGAVKVDDLMRDANQLGAVTSSNVHSFRELCGQVDERVAPIIKAVVEAGLVPIVIGGGHNNAYPIIKGVAQGLRASGKVSDEGTIAAANVDVHADFRAMEGHHSGNGFRYAHHEGFLGAYFIIGLDRQCNNSEAMQALGNAGANWFAYDDIVVTSKIKPEDLCQGILAGLSTPCGVEIDLDTISGMPASAGTPCGLEAAYALRVVHLLALSNQACYLHIAEGAPKLAPNGESSVGKIVSKLVSVFVQARG